VLQRRAADLIGLAALQCQATDLIDLTLASLLKSNLIIDIRKQSHLVNPAFHPCFWVQRSDVDIIPVG